MKRRNGRKRNVYLRVHARRRAQERYGITLDRKKTNELVRLIQSPNSYREQGEVVTVRDESNNRKLCFVWCSSDQIWLLVSYDRSRKEISSVLPTEGDGLLYRGYEIPDYRPS